MENWVYNGVEINEIEQFPPKTIGFIYKITNKSTGKFYIGKKNLWFTRTKSLTKKELAALTDKRMSKKKKITTESDWKTYFGSDISLKNDVKLYGDSNFSRQIVHFCNDKKSLTYQEIRYQILFGVLESDNCYNGTIGGRYFRKDAI